MEREILWECAAQLCPTVMSEGTGKKKKIIISDGKGEVRFTDEEFREFKKAIKDGKL